MANVLLYDHVLGADPDRPGGWNGAVRQGRRVPRAVRRFSFIAAVTTTHRAGHRRADPAPAPDGPRGQAGGRAGRAVGQPLPARHRHGLERRRVRGPQRDVLQPRPAPGRAGRADAPAVDRGHVHVRRRVPHDRRRRHQPPPDRVDPDLVRRLGAGRARALRSARRRVDPAGHAERRVARERLAADPRRPRGRRAVDGRLRRPGPGPVRRRRSRTAGARTPPAGRRSAPPTWPSPPTTPARPTSTATWPASPSTRPPWPTEPPSGRGPSQPPRLGAARSRYRDARAPRSAAARTARHRRRSPPVRRCGSVRRRGSCG